MFQSLRARGRTRGGVEIQMAPLIDMVFILLIFFLVTTTFVRETGIQVQRPRASSAGPVDPRHLLVGVDPDGRVFVEERRVDLVSLRPLIARQLQGRPELSVVVVADQQTPTGTVVRVIDECQLAGAAKIAIASRKER